jgi:hypothetical protein
MWSYASASEELIGQLIGLCGMILLHSSATTALLVQREGTQPWQTQELYLEGPLQLHRIEHRAQPQEPAAET